MDIKNTPDNEVHDAFSLADFLDKKFKGMLLPGEKALYAIMVDDLIAVCQAQEIVTQIEKIAPSSTLQAAADVLKAKNDQLLKRVLSSKNSHDVYGKAYATEFDEISARIFADHKAGVKAGDMKARWIKSEHNQRDVNRGDADAMKALAVLDKPFTV